ncbi:MAG: AAA family ATPase [Paludibacteraceae bacterium]|nr:AAA family ATPase [Paludibacteraceae bacterium]
MLQREQYQLVMSRLNEPRKFIQIIEGPRQVGKSTLVKQILQNYNRPYIHFAADNVPASQSVWITSCWEAARARLATEHLPEILIVIDEIQRLSQWADVVKKEWDNDTFTDTNIKVLLLGSSRLRLEKGQSESLKGRFEVIKMPNWSFAEMRDAFGFSLDEFIYYGGYPGSAELIKERDRWLNYIESSIVAATINNDILMDTPISKPALLRRTFELSSAYSGQILSLTKMIGQLQDAGNTTTLTGYLELLDTAGMVCGLQKFAMDKARRRASVPKYQVYNNALLSLYDDANMSVTRQNPQRWGRWVESAIGAHIVNQSYAHNFKVYYWREGNHEVDFVLVRNGRIIAIEVKSNEEKTTAGLATFEQLYHPYKTLLVGPNAFPIDTFLQTSLDTLFV